MKRLLILGDCVKLHLLCEWSAGRQLTAPSCRLQSPPQSNLTFLVGNVKLARFTNRRQAGWWKRHDYIHKSYIDLHYSGMLIFQITTRSNAHTHTHTHTRNEPCSKRNKQQLFLSFFFNQCPYCGCSVICLRHHCAFVSLGNSITQSLSESGCTFIIIMINIKDWLVTSGNWQKQRRSLSSTRPSSS